jgi:adenine deaminase
MLSRTFFQAIPKVELHCHLLGSVRRETFEAWVARESAPISPEQIDSFFTPSHKPMGAIRVLRALEQHLIRSPDDLYRLTIEYLDAAHRDAVCHAEFFWNPTGTAHLPGMGYAQAQGAILAAIGDAAAQWGIRGLMIPSIDREAGERAALDMVEAVIAHRNAQVPGIGIDYREADGPPERFAAAFAAARAAGLKTTAHAGEFGLPASNVQTALEVLRIDRLDHAYTAINDPSLVRKLLDRGMVITVAPTNSYYRRTLAPERWALDHPIRAMGALGLKIHPNTDDPSLHFVNPSLAWEMMHRDFGFDLAALHGFVHNGIDGAWLDDSERRALRLAMERGWQTAVDQLESPT